MRRNAIDTRYDDITSESGAGGVCRGLSPTGQLFPVIETSDGLGWQPTLPARCYRALRQAALTSPRAAAEP